MTQRPAAMPLERRPARPGRTLAVLLLVAACALRSAAGGSWDSYMIGPASWKDVMRPAATGDAHAPGNSSAAGAGPPSRHLAQLPPRTFAPVFNVCLSSWVPMVRCEPGGEPVTFKGYQVELFRMLAKEVGWAEADYTFTCMDYSDVLADLRATDGSCSLSATGVEVFPDLLASGLKFTWPTYKSGLRVMVHGHLQQGSTWAFSEVFHWNVWLVLGVTAVAVGLLVGFIEWCTVNNTSNGNRGWHAWEWYSLAKMMHVISHVGDPGTDASRVLVLGYGFLVMVMVSMYTAVSASRITAESLVHPIHSKADLVGPSSPFRVETWERYVAPLSSHHGIRADGKRWDAGDELAAMIGALRAGSYDALVLDAPVLEYTVGTNDACDLFLAGEAFESFSLALAFPADFPDATVFGFSEAIVKLQTYQGALDMLENVYIKTGGTSKCFSSDAGGHGSGDTIALRQVSGLWYILLVTVGLCFLLTLAHNARKDPAHIARLHKVGSLVTGRSRRSGSGDGSSAPGAPRSPQHAGPGGAASHAASDAGAAARPGQQQPAGGGGGSSGWGRSGGGAASGVSWGAVSWAGVSSMWGSNPGAADSAASTQDGSSGAGEAQRYRGRSGSGGSGGPAGLSMPGGSGGRRKPSALQMFLGTTSFAQREDVDDGEGTPHSAGHGSPKKSGRRLKFNPELVHPGEEI